MLPLGGGRTAPITAVDVARAVALALDKPAPHIGRIYNLTGPELADLTHFAKLFSEALGRTITYRDVPVGFEDAKIQLDAARLGFEELLGRFLHAFADQAAEFYAGSGNDRQRALELARANVANRQTRRAIKQAEAIRASEVA